MKIFKGNSVNGIGSGTRGRLYRRSRKRLKKTDIGGPQDFVHISSVKSPTIKEVDFNDPLIADFLRRAEVTADDLLKPEIQKLVRDFIYRVGLDAIRKESESSLNKQHSPRTNSEQTEEVSIFPSINERSLTSSSNTQSAPSVTYCSDHDIEITSELDDVFSEQEASPKSIGFDDDRYSSKYSTSEDRKSDSTNDGTNVLPCLGNKTSSPDPDLNHLDSVDEPTSPKEEDKREESKCDHAQFLNELKGAIRKREVRMKKKMQSEIERSEVGWTGWQSPTKPKCHVSFFGPESPSPKPKRTIHTKWDLSSESNHVDETDVNEVDILDSNEVDTTDSNLKKPRLPLTKGTEAINKFASIDELAMLSLSSTNDEDLKSTINSSFMSVLEGKPSSDQDLSQKATQENIQSIPDLLNDKPAPVTPANASEDLSIAANPEEANKTNEEQNTVKNSSKRQKPSPAKNISSWFKGKNQVNKSKIVPDSMPQDDVKNPVANEKKQQPDSENIGSSVKKAKEEKKRNQSMFSSLTKKRVKEELPNACVAGDDMPSHKEGKSLLKIKSTSSSKPAPITSSEKQFHGSKGRREVKKQDICVMKDLRHRTHITWDPIRHKFVLHHTDDDDLRKILLEEKFCEEASVPKQRRHSYSMAIDVPDVELNENDPRSSIQSSNSLTSNTTIFSRGAKKKAPIPRPRSDIPKLSQPQTDI